MSESKPADYAYYSGRACYYDTNIDPIKAGAADAIAGVILNMMKDLGPGNTPWPSENGEQ